MPSDALISLEGVGKRYRLGGGHSGLLRDRLGALLRGRLATGSAGDLWALRDVSFDVPAGEAFGIIGRNGAGKSTMLKLLSRVTAPTEGRITLRGRVASLLEVGTGFHPDLTGRENVFLSGAILGMRREEIRRKFDAIVAFAEVERFLDTPVRRYSSGMYVRLAFAVAAFLESEVLVLDEVLAVGDLAFQRKCLSAMDATVGGGRTLLLVSHDLSLIRRACSRVALLEGGRLVAVGPAGEMVERYAGGERPALWQRAAAGSGPHFTRAALRGGGAATTGDAVQLDLAWTLPDDRPGVRVEVRVHVRGGAVIFATLPEDAGERVPSTAGRYAATVTLPSHLLLAGEHTVTLGLWEHGRQLDWLEEVLGLHLDVDPAGPAYRGPDPARAGVVQAACHWAVRAA